jgi:hypothetical protein
MIASLSLILLCQLVGETFVRALHLPMLTALAVGSMVAIVSVVALSQAAGLPRAVIAFQVDAVAGGVFRYSHGPQRARDLAACAAGDQASAALAKESTALRGCSAGLFCRHGGWKKYLL